MTRQLTDEERLALQVCSRHLQIIGGGLVAGVVLFTAIAWLKKPMPPAGALFSPLAAGLAVMMAGAAFAAPKLIARLPQGSLAKEPAGDVQRIMTRTIISLALLEGPALFNVLALLLEGHGWSLAVIGGLVALMLIQIPSATRLQFALESELAEQS
jgi:hypothetical protein